MSKDLKKFEKKLDEAVKEYAKLGGLAVEIGLPSDRKHEPSGLMLAELGAIHEFGLGNVPERSFLRGAVQNGTKEIKDNFEITAKKSLKGDSSDALMEDFALFGQGLVQEYISNGKQNFTPLDSPRKDGSANPLNDTGALRQGIIGVVVSD